MSSSDLSCGSGETRHLSEVRILLLGCRNAGKSSVGNIILGREEFDLERSPQCVKRQGEVAGRKITVVEAPGWQRNKAVRNSTELLKQEIVLSVSMCPPGPHAVLLVLGLDVKSWKSEKNVLEGYLALLTERVWSHVIVLFTFGDCLRDTTIEQCIGRGQEYLQGLVEKCGNRYHVLNNTKRDDDTQVEELLEKVEMMVTGNRGCHFEMDTKILQDVKERRREEEKKANERRMKVSKRRKDVRSHMCDKDYLLDLRVLLLGYRNAGKSLSGNTILGNDEFTKGKNRVNVLTGHKEVAGRKISVVEAPGWQRNKAIQKSTTLFIQETALSLSMCHPGPHAVMLVICLDLTFGEKQRRVLEGYLNLLGDKVWSHAMVLFTFGDFLGDSSIEQYIEREGATLQCLVEKCGNRYHVFNNKKSDDSQVTQLLEKIDEMVAENGGCHLEMDTKMLTKMEHEMKEKKEEKKSRVGDSAAASDTPPVRRPAKMGSPTCTSQSTHSLTSRNTPGQDLKSDGSYSTCVQIFRQGSSKSPKQKPISTPRVQPPADIQPFMPELVEKCAEDKNRDAYRFLCPRAGQFQCKVTDLVFEMEDKGEVLYKIVPWDRLFQKEPAGPLYNIDCLEGSIRHLHLPHCETCKDKDKLTVTHVRDGKKETIQPLTVTNTHVIIEIQHLSRFGLTWNLPWIRSRIRAQVLLFYKKIPEHRVTELHIHLLPGNVPVSEVKRQDESYKYSGTTSDSELTPGQIYKPCCKTTERNYTPRPEAEKFHRNYGPNYHPAFVVRLNIEADKFTLILLDKKGKEVWTPPEILITETRASPRTDGTGADFVDQHRESLIQRFSSVMEVADGLKSKNMITNEMYSNIQAKSTCQDQMRELYTCLNSSGRDAKQEFYNILEKNHLLLVNDLKSGSG